MAEFPAKVQWVTAGLLYSLYIPPPKKAEFPEKPVEMTVLFGGTAQTIGQLLADLMSKNMSEPVVPVSRNGGGGSVGYQYVHGTDPDGYNIVWNSNSISTGYHGGKMDFDYTAFAPIAKISNEVPALAVRADSGWETIADMAKAVKESGQKLKVGASGKGSFTHLTTEFLKIMNRQLPNIFQALPQGR